MAQDPSNIGNEQNIRTLFGVMNSILHIIESLISQEELLDSYETNLDSIMNACQFILSQEYPRFAQVPPEIIKARGKVVSLVYLYSFKFSEFFRGHMDPMFQSIW